MTPAHVMVAVVGTLVLAAGSSTAQALHWSEHRLWPVAMDAAAAGPVPGRLLLLETSGTGELMTWTGIGGEFVGRPDQSPPTRSAYSLCLDTLRRRVLMVAGRGGPQPETWSYDGRRWSLLPTSPRRARPWISRVPSGS